jgi:hypothetical protein
MHTQQDLLQLLQHRKDVVLRVQLLDPSLQEKLQRLHLGLELQSL